jgi:hypothetical protein
MTGLAFPLACFTGLAVGGVEVAIAGYARWPTVLAYTADGVTVANTASLQWPYATASWGVLDTVLIYDAPTGGNQLAVLAAITPIEIRQYDAARIPAAGIVLSYLAAARPYGAAKYGRDAFGFSRSLWPARAAVFGASGLGGGAFSARGYDIPTSAGTPLSGSFGPLGYGNAGAVPLERVFDQVHVCAPGTWAPGPCALAA